MTPTRMRSAAPSTSRGSGRKRPGQSGGDFADKIPAGIHDLSVAGAPSENFRAFAEPRTMLPLSVNVPRRRADQKEIAAVETLSSPNVFSRKLV